MANSKAITGSAGAGSALPPFSYTIAQLIELHGAKLADFVERDGTTLTTASVVYLIATEAASSNFKVVLKATADGEGNNPLKAVKTFTTPIAKK